MQIALRVSYFSHGKEKLSENDKYAYIHNVMSQHLAENFIRA